MNVHQPIVFEASADNHQWSKMVRELSLELHGDRDKIAERLLLLADEDHGLREILLKYGARYLARQAVSQGNTSVAHIPRADNTSGLLHVAALNEQTLFETYILPSGIAFGDATSADLQAAIECHASLAQSNAIKARWFLLTKEKMKGKPGRVRDYMTPDQAKSLREEARKTWKESI